MKGKREVSIALDLLSASVKYIIYVSLSNN